MNGFCNIYKRYSHITGGCSRLSYKLDIIKDKAYCCGNCINWFIDEPRYKRSD